MTIQVDVEELETNKYFINFSNLSYFLFKGDANPPVLYLLKKKDPDVRLCEKCDCPILIKNYEKQVGNAYIKDNAVNIQLPDNKIICISLTPYKDYYRLTIITPDSVRVVGTKIEEAFQIQELGKNLQAIIKSL